MKILRRLTVLSLVCGMVACGGESGENNANNINNINKLNNTNNANNMPDMGMDTGEDMPVDDMDMRPQEFSCAVTGWSPYTLAQGESNTVTVDVLCEGDAPGGEVTAPLNVTLPGGEVVVQVTSTLQAVAGETTATFTLNADETGTVHKDSLEAYFGNGEQVVFEAGAANINHRIRKRPDLLLQEWDELIDEQLEQVRENPLALNSPPAQTWVVDANADGDLDILAAGRDGTLIKQVTLFGPDFMAGAVKQYDVKLTTTDTGGDEYWRMGRVKGGTDDSNVVLYWNAIDATPQESSLSTVVMPIKDGVMGTAVAVSSKSQNLPDVVQILDMQLVDPGTLIDGDAPELMVLYHGDALGKSTFVTTHTISSSGKTQLVSQLDTLSTGVSGAEVDAGNIKVGLLRGWKGSPDPRVPALLTDMFAYTYGTQDPNGGTELRRVILNGGEAGAVLGTVVVTPQANESGGHVFAMQDGTGTELDIFLMTGDSTTDEPILRSFPVNSAGVISSTGATYSYRFRGPKAKIARRFREPLFGPSKALTRSPSDVIYTSAEHQYMTSYAAAGGSSAQFLIGTAVDFEINGRRYSGEVTHEASTTQSVNPLYTQPFVAGSDVSGYQDGDFVTQGRTYTGGLNLGIRTETDSVTVATHPAGTSLRFGGLADFFTFTLAYNGGDNLANFKLPEGSTNTVALFHELTTPGQFGDALILVESNDAVADTSRWYVWHSIAEGQIEGPAIIDIPAALGEFGLTESAAPNLTFSHIGPNGLNELKFDLDAVYAAATNKGTINVSENDVNQTGVMVSRLRPTWHHIAVRRGARERATKRRVRHRIQVNAPAQPLEQFTVVANDEADACAYNTVLFPGDFSTTPVVLDDSSADGCFDMHVPVAVADFCGVGGVQVVTGAVQDPSADTWTWEYLLWMREGTEIVATELGTVDTAKDVEPDVTAGDVNGDLLMDLVVNPGPGRAGRGQSAYFSGEVFFSDGLGGTVDSPATIESMDAFVREIPGAGLGLAGGQIACGETLQCAFGKGTTNAATNSASRPELL